MFEILIKHKRAVFFAMLVMLIGPFVLWGGSFGVSPGVDGRGYQEGYAVAIVGGEIVEAAQFRQALQNEAQRRSQGGEEVSVEKLATDGTADQVLQEFIKGALVRNEISKLPFIFDRNYLIERLKEDPNFQDENGVFDPKRWNNWIESMEGRNWTAVYADVTQQLARDIFTKRIMASARVREADIRKQFEEEFTKINVKYAAIEPPVEVTEEEIQNEYDTNRQLYQNPKQLRAQFVAVDISEPQPDFLGALVERAKAGAPLQELATEYSSAEVTALYTELPWLDPAGELPDFQNVLATAAKGDILGPIEAQNGYYIYAVVDERDAEIPVEAAGAPATEESEPAKKTITRREILVEQIFIRPTPNADERNARIEAANQALAGLKEAEDFEAAAKEKGLEVKTSGLFSISSEQIENIPQADAAQFRFQLAQLEEGASSDPIAASKNVYAARIVEVIPATDKPLEEVLEQVTGRAMQNKKRAQAYVEQAQTLAKEFAASGQSLDALRDAHPELNLEIKESGEFTIGEFDYRKGIFWNPREVYEQIKDKQPGALAGPVTDFMRKVFLLEVVSLTAPDDAAWQEHKDRLREAALNMERQRRVKDYFDYLLARAYETGKPVININEQTYLRVLGLDAPEQPAPAGDAAPAAQPSAAPADSATESPAESPE